MPCFNDGIYIEESINSVLNQTYSDIELIIIDDGSDDHLTIEILKNIDNPRISVLRVKHFGPANARNFGIENAKGKYILPVDADDKIDPSYVEKALKILDESEEVGAVYCQADLFGKKSGRWHLPDFSLEHMLLDNIVFVTAMFRKEDWEKVGGFSTDMKHGMEDYDFWLSMLELGKSIFQIPEILFHYRIKEISRTTNFTRSKENVKETYKLIYLRHKNLYSKNMDIYVLAMRNALIDHIFMKQQYVASCQIFNIANRFPVLKRIIKKTLNMFE